jgi:hypothetical protein
MRRTEYRCHYCAQSSSRRWNMKIHIQRRHTGKIDEQALMSQLPLPSITQTSSNARNSIPNNNYDYYQNHNTSYVHEKPPTDANHYQKHSFSFHQQDESQEQENDATSQMRATLRGIYDFMRQVIEIKNMSKQLQSPSSSFEQISRIMPAFTTPSLKPINLALKFVKHLADYLVLDTTFRNNKNVGFRGHLCNNCFQCWVDPVYSNSHDLRSLIKSKKPSLHACNPKEVTDAQNTQGIQSKRNVSENALIDLLVLTILFYLSYHNQNKIFLRTEELISQTSAGDDFYPIPEQGNDYRHPPPPPPQLQVDRTQQQIQHTSTSISIEGEEVNCNPVDIDLAKVDEHHWAYRGIKEALNEGKSSIELTASELIDFMKATKASYGMYTEKINDVPRRYFMYLSYEKNKNDNI